MKVILGNQEKSENQRRKPRRIKDPTRIQRANLDKLLANSTYESAVLGSLADCSLLVTAVQIN